MHEVAVRRLAEEVPEMTLGNTAPPISAPFMEMSLAYGLAFRERSEVRKRVEKQQRKLDCLKVEAFLSTINKQSANIDKLSGYLLDMSCLECRLLRHAAGISG